MFRAITMVQPEKVIPDDYIGWTGRRKPRRRLWFHPVFPRWRKRFYPRINLCGTIFNMKMKIFTSRSVTNQAISTLVTEKGLNESKQISTDVIQIAKNIVLLCTDKSRGPIEYVISETNTIWLRDRKSNWKIESSNSKNISSIRMIKQFDVMNNKITKHSSQMNVEIECQR